MNPTEREGDMKKVKLPNGEILDDCIFCPVHKHDYDQCLHPEILNKNLEGRDLTVPAVIPDWCPLPDVEAKP